ncbi:hypothetical protein G6F22_018068 [Rhizopus arrhizus]|nr:hypothetical protein G6F22_018068 [Rhizopus arrhizus]
MRSGSRATPAPPAAAIATVSDESNTGPRASTPLTPVACSQRGHSSLRRRARAGAHSGAKGASRIAVQAWPCQSPSPKRIARSSPSPARSMRLLWVCRRSSMSGCAASNAASRGSSQPVAKVPTTPSVSTSRAGPPV